MSEWWTYSPSDLLLFSPRVYYRLFELHNHALWPAHVVTVALGLAIAVALIRPNAQRIRLVLIVLGALWILVAWAFFWERYTTINWAAVYAAPVYALQGLLLVGAALLRPMARVPAPLARAAGLGLFAIVLAGYPLVAPITGRSWSAAEVFGIAPDPTALATLAVLAVTRPGFRWLLMVIPLAWTVISAATLSLMDSPDAWVGPALALAAILIALLPAK